VGLSADQRPGTILQVRWSEAFPALILVRAVTTSLSWQMLVLAAIALAMIEGGWHLVERTWPGTPPTHATFIPLAQAAHVGWWPPEEIAVPVDDQSASFTRSLLSNRWSGPLLQAWAWAIEPMDRFRNATNVREVVCLHLLVVWLLMVAAVLGTAMARFAARRLTGDAQRSDVAWSERWSQSLAVIVASLVAYGCLVGVTGGLVFAGWVAQWNWIGPLVGLGWGLVLAGGLLWLVIAGGLLIGWPLLVAASAVERADAFDLLSRWYAYVYQRPIHLAGYLLFASAIGLVAQACLSSLVTAVGRVVDYCVSYAGTHALPASAEWWNLGLRQIAIAYPLSCVVSVSVGVYLLLRKEIDDCEMDQ
jgi:hypothetical protein